MSFQLRKGNGRPAGFAHAGELDVMRTRAR